MHLTQDNDVVHKFTSDRSNQPFGNAVLPADEGGADPASGEIDEIKRRVLRRAEQLSNIYLDEAENATDQSSLELGRKLAAQSNMRLAGLRNIASASAPR